MALPIFAITIFVSAFLLFLVQPLIGKLILPKLGGTPQVWNTCMVFFQSVLLMGYAYTHWVSTRLRLRQQLMVHCGLLAVPIVTMLVFPIYARVQGWSPPPGANPIFNTLVLLGLIIGIPFFVVSTSAPLLQKWFGYSGHLTAKDPYFLYSVSNIGSLLSLFFYPALIEPFTYLKDQSYIWFGGYLLLAGCVMYCAYVISKLAPSDEQILALETVAAAPPPPPPVETPVPAPTPAPAVASSTAVKASSSPAIRSIQRKKGYKAPGRPDAVIEPEHEPIHKHAPVVAKGITAEMTWWRRIRWVLLAAVPSSMMLGVTSYISTDLSPFPLVWIIPLALYLLSFILVYEKGLKWTEKRYPIFGPQGLTLHEMVIYVAQPLGLLFLCFIILTHTFDPATAVTIGMIGFFMNALGCHGELAEDRPSTKHLTEYFLLMSFGGMLGGVFNGIIAPVVFYQGILEFYIVIVVACLVRPQYVASGWFDETVLNAFPGLQNWTRNQGDEMAKSMGYAPPRSTYLFNIFLDIVFGAFILAIAYWLKTSSAIGWTIKNLKIGQDWQPFFYRLMLFGFPMVFCFFFAGRPLRMGLAVGGLLLACMYMAESDNRDLLAQKRTYFGVLRVQLDAEFSNDPEEKLDFRRKQVKGPDGEMVTPPYSYTFLMHGTTYHGRNYRYNANDDTDLSRLATTYYHRYGPVGVVMERDNWFKGKQNTFHADMRGPAAIVADLFGAAGTCYQPWGAIVEAISEPAFATIGLGTGTMVSYARPFQHMTYYEIDDQIREFSLPPEGGEAYFTFAENAVRRGVNLEIIMGDARLSLEPTREAKNLHNAIVYQGDFSKINPKVANRSYATAPYVSWTRAKAPADSIAPNREKYYKVINVDAFSSDAIPVHLVTKQAIEIYMNKLRDDGVLCVHTSNRHMDLVRPVARIAMELSKEAVNRGEPEIKCVVGKDSGSNDRSGRTGTNFMGHFGSEYVMIYRDVALDKDAETKRIQNFGEWIKFLKTKKEEFEKNAKDAEDAKKKGEVPDAAKLCMTPDGHAPNGWQILNSPVEWYDPYEDAYFTRQDGRKFLIHRKVTTADSLWTDDYSYILGVVRWHWPWQ